MPDSRDTEHAIGNAVFWLRVALDRHGHDGRKYSPQVKGCLWAAQPALENAQRWSRPEHDQVRVEDVI